MASNSLGQVFRITTWGESHGPAIGVLIDGCPAGIAINEDDIWAELKTRAPGQDPRTSPRQERDKPQILSGLFEGQTTGAPISILIANEDASSQHYHSIKDLMRPGHAQFTYLEKYGCYDYRGGGRASARETAARVAAAAIALKILAAEGVEITSYLSEMGGQDQDMDAYLATIIAEQDSVGGVVSFAIQGAPVGLGDPMYEKLEAKLASAMMSIPASKGFEIGQGFAAARMKGSEHNDSYMFAHNKIQASSNQAGGILAGISTGANIYGRVAFKPTSSIAKPQTSVDIKGRPAIFELPKGSRHDPCLAIRAVPVVKAMCALVMVDALLMYRLSRWK